MDSDHSSNRRKPEEDSGAQKGKAPADWSSRIAASASLILRDVIGPSSASELPNSLSSGTGLGSKLQNGPSSSTQAHWIESLPSRSRAPGFATGHVEGSNESFRSSPVQASHEAEFEEFLSPSYSGLVPELTRGSQSPESWTNEFHHRPFEHGGISNTSTGFGVQYDDGAEVRMLLSDPNIDLQPDFMDFEMADTTDSNMDDLFETKLSPGEQQAADRIRSALPPPPVHQAIPRNNPLNLIPGVMGLGEDLHADATPQRIAELLSDLEGSEWEDVLDRYTDDVWGESLQRFVAESIEKGEISQEAGNADRIQLDGSALSRLRMILGHVAEEASARTASHQTSGVQQNSKNVSQTGTMFSTGLRSNAMQHQMAIPFQASSMMHQHGPTQFQHQQMTNNAEKAAQRAWGGHQERRENAMANKQADEELSTPAFHCPWIRCHQVSAPGCFFDSLMPMPI